MRFGGFIIIHHSALAYVIIKLKIAEIHFSSVNVVPITQTSLNAKDMENPTSLTTGSTYRKTTIPKAISAMTKSIQTVVIPNKKVALIWSMAKRIEPEIREEMIRRLIHLLSGPLRMSME